MTAPGAIRSARLVLLAALVLVTFVSGAGTAKAAGRNDIVVMINGDRMTGSILSLTRGRLQLKTDNIGTIDIEWDKIATVESLDRFTIITIDGRRLVGSLRPGAKGILLLAGDGGELSFELSGITGIEALGQRFWDKLDGSVGAGFNYTRSSGVSQFTFNSDVTYRQPKYVASVIGAATLTGQSADNESGKVANGQVMYERFRGRRLFAGGAAQFETNESLGITLRSQLGGLVGARLVNTNRAGMQVGAGLVGNRELGVDVPATTNLEGLIALSGSYYTYDRPKTNLDASVQYYPSLSDWGRQRLQATSAVKREVLRNFFISLNLYDTFDSAPPNPDASHNDFGVTVTLNWSFGS
jgi:hypothetical protein